MDDPLKNKWRSVEYKIVQNLLSLRVAKNTPTFWKVVDFFSILGGVRPFEKRLLWSKNIGCLQL